ncbi:phosphatidylinositol N-acetylglucosaminyltransferase KNAG_0A01940 [Huiozyma naganishii CBS 8797]|uniref:Phosphatidylinositol N-acetylglucosaminyltransferase n=1 Tax=Huiozyma naganishii (strain ATCC MYA-139 / BCRC 22969 / CBS 8797 / KCTC 17520 / NBRC 10181 / NCYC 3082 / Yp74L-3) TaxID=1071383 RepID=J7REA3_HUIN7|nr:hypothetical protein KNAG_0A01940 [Kazachstania naganishii CBS 8797]CCK67883.1 hypothetical protein KNAG_0A01940 [Kazachstania naganishii CBS 8797]
MDEQDVARQSSQANRSRKPWERLLWLKQEYPDNYTDPNFVRFMTTFPLTQYNYDYEVIRQDFMNFYFIILNKCFVFITFGYVYDYEYDPVPLCAAVTFFTAAWSIYQMRGQVLQSLKPCVIITFTLLTISPVLKSLSKSTSSDSIWTISFWLTLYYLFTVFKSMAGTNRSRNLSTNVLLMNVTLLSSRLATTTQVFCFLLLCIQINVILPRLVNLSSFAISLVSNVVVYSYISVTLNMPATIVFGVFSLLFIGVLPRLFWYWETYYKCPTPEVLSFWDASVPILD